LTWRSQVFVLFALAILVAMVREGAVPAACPFPGLRPEHSVRAK
jgi:hypothetical protein